jgi:isoleucyl-tRNA synthetase
MTRDYKETLFLPKTDFSLQGVKDEAGIRARFASHYEDEMSIRWRGRATFVLHDGPPYANGDIHMGHALNKILKDFVVRSRWAAGQNVEYIPGWDCHGLPIEWQVEKNLLAAGQNKSDYTAPEFRQLCRDYAKGWVDAQRTQFKSLGVVGDWNNPYLTMDFKSEATISQTLHMMMMSNMLYRGVKPVLWSVVEETALAEAEVVKADIRVTSVHVRFWLEGLADTSVVIWTTTPWTLPANRAVAYNPAIEYGTYKVTASANESVSVGDKLVMAKALVEATMAAIKVTEYDFVEDFNPVGVTCEHPLRGAFEDGGFHFSVPLIPAKHVTSDTGTGLVHIAPEHGPEDFVCWNEARLGEVPTTVGGDGRYTSNVHGLAGVSVLEQTPKGDYIFEFTNAKIIKLLAVNETVLSSEKVTINYPHSWRSKAPLIYRTTPQWFISMDAIEDIRVNALRELEDVTFLPESGGNRLRAAVESRPDWLVSRQRVWGTPMAIFLNKETGKPLLSDALNSKINNAFTAHGGDAWWKFSIAEWFAHTEYAGREHEFEMVMDVLDVWFDSGCSHLLTGDDNPPADLYLEGSDQARGWFGSSALVGVAMADALPFRSVLTHGFVLDDKGKKMSKSEGNVVDPLVEAKKYGTDVLRLWVALGDYTQDTRVGDEILKTTASMYKRLRNTLRYLVSNLQGFGDGPGETRDDLFYEYPPLEKYMLYLLHELTPQIEAAYREYRFNDVCKLLLDFSTNDLSAFYFDIRKDALYCDRSDSVRRLACRATLFHIVSVMAQWLAPILPYTVAEMSDHMQMPGLAGRFGPTPHMGAQAPMCAVENERWTKVRHVLSLVTPVLEEKRAAKEIGSALDAKVIVYLPQDLFDAFDGIEAEDVFRTSQAVIALAEEVSILVLPAEGTKCARSRRITTDVGSDPRYPDLSARDADAVAHWDATPIE